MQLHLVLPGLLWPGRLLRDTTHDLDLPALSRLLGRGRLAWQPPRVAEAALCHAFGIETDPLPFAALRLLGEGGHPGSDIWLCADPVHLAIEQRRLTLTNAGPHADDDEMGEIAAALAPLLAESASEVDSSILEFRAGRSGHGYLRLSSPPAITTTPPSAAAGHDDMLPQGPDARSWRRLCNEAQMVLHALPLNTRRDAAGQPRLNSLWLWGAGRLPAQVSDRYTRIIGDDPVLRGLARLAGQPLEQTASLRQLLLGPRASTLLLLDTLQAPARAYDALHWRETLQTLERDWLQPLLVALRDGRLTRLRLSALGPEDGLDIDITGRDLLRFWRKPLPPHALREPGHAR